MTTKSYGAGVSGYLDPAGRSWETTAYQAGKPVLDKELNLIQDSNQEALVNIQRASFPSGWIAQDFLGSSTSAIFVSAPTIANALRLSALKAAVNGWLVTVERTDDPGVSTNLLTLSAGPAGAGARRTDFVVLEVWRRLLTAAPSTTGKSPTGRIWWNGNVKIARDVQATGVITTVVGANLVDGETFTLNDGTNPASVFEFDDDASVTPGNIAVTFTAGDTATQVRDAIVLAVNGVGAGLAITAAPGGANTLTLANDAVGVLGNQPLLETVLDTGFTVLGMSGGMDSEDLTQNYADDILDAGVGAATTGRVQIQYRLRVISGVDVFTYPSGIDDPTVVANSVPAAAAAPDGVATVFTYTNQSAAGDAGLWRAGDGNPANTLGTVDGYMYAIPLCAVFRRNITAFDRVTNHNGGVARPGPSDRPDGYFSDILVARDVLDLRMGTSFTGWDLSEILQKNFNYLLDNRLCTEIASSFPIGGGSDGHTLFWADEIGVSNAHGGAPPLTGDTGGAEFVGEFDAVRRTFSDRTVTEVVVLRYLPTDGSGGGPNWADNDVLTIDPSALNVWPYGALNWSSRAPSGVTFTRVLKVHFQELSAAGGANRSSITFGVTGLGTLPQGSLSLDIGDVIVLGVTNEPVYIWLEIEYPVGVGLAKTPTADFGADTLYINNPAQLPAANPIYFDQMYQFGLDHPHREVHLEYQTVEQTFTTRPLTGITDFYIPERVLTVNAARVNGAPVGGVTIDSSGYVLDIPALNPGDLMEVDVVTARPLPMNDEQVTLYYETRAPQTIREAFLPNDVSLVPVLVSKSLYATVVGSGSADEAFPFPQQYVQAGSVYPGSGGTFSGEHMMSDQGLIATVLGSFNTGFLELSTLIPMVPLPEDMSFRRAPGDADAENRTYYKESLGSYTPSAVAASFNYSCRHKSMVPIVVTVPQDTTFAKKGQLLLLVISNYADTSLANLVGFISTLSANTTSASLYHLFGRCLRSA